MAPGQTRCTIGMLVTCPVHMMQGTWQGKHADLQSLGTANLDVHLTSCAGYCCSFGTSAKPDLSLQGHALILAWPPHHQLLRCPSTSGRHVHKRSDPPC